MSGLYRFDESCDACGATGCFERVETAEAENGLFITMHCTECNTPANLKIPVPRNMAHELNEMEDEIDDDWL